MDELLLGSYQQQMEQVRARRALEAQVRAAACAQSQAALPSPRPGLRQALQTVFALRRRLPA